MPGRNPDESWDATNDATDKGNTVPDEEFFERDWVEFQTGVDWPVTAPDIAITEQNASQDAILERETSHTYVIVAERTKPTSRPPKKPNETREVIVPEDQEPAIESQRNPNFATPESSSKFPRATLDLDGFILAGYYDAKTVNGFFLAYETASKNNWPIKIIDGIDAEGRKRKEIYIKPPLTFMFQVGNIRRQIQRTLKKL